MEYENLGEHQVKNISTPIRVYRVLSLPGAAAHRVVQAKNALGRRWRIIALSVAVVALAVLGIWQFYKQRPIVEPASVEKMAYPLPEKPSIAVLPFDNMSGDQTQDFIADGITENIITALSKYPNLFVIARNSVFTYKGKPVKINQVSEELGVQYVLEGSIQKSGDRIRLTAQLIDAIKGYHLWAERFDVKFKDLFTLQDDVTMRILKGLQQDLTGSSKGFVRGTNNIDAYLRCIKGTYYQNRFTKQDMLIARNLLEEAIAFDSNYTYAQYQLAFNYMHFAYWAFSSSPKADIAKAEEINKKLSLDESYRSSPEFYMLSGAIYEFKRQVDKALSFSKKAVDLAPNWANALSRYSSMLSSAGKVETAILYYEKSIRLNPYPPAVWLFQLAMCYHREKRFADAIETYEKALHFAERGEFSPHILHSGLTFAYLELGMQDKALLHATAALKLEPNFPLMGWATAQLEYQDQEYLKRLSAPLAPLTDMKSIEKEIYAHTGAPVFKFEYPRGSRETEHNHPDQVLAMKTPGGANFYASVSDIPDGISLADVGPKVYKAALENFGSNVEVISNKEINLRDGTQAYKTEIKWLFIDGKHWINTIAISTFKDGKRVSVEIHPAVGDASNVAWIIESLTFE